ncbi:MAG: hypothetical protein FJ147_15305 [Deltaproteobacteria bacterium]|nr:hypothetical protein [Deltaproteobacteria bacterium]
MVSSLIPALVQRLSTPVNHYCGKLFPATALPWRHVCLCWVAVCLICLSWVVISLWLATGTPLSYGFLYSLVRELAIWQTSIASSHISHSVIVAFIALCILWGGVALFQHWSQIVERFPFWHAKSVPLALTVGIAFWHGSLLSSSSPTFQLALLAPWLQQSFTETTTLASLDPAALAELSARQRQTQAHSTPSPTHVLLLVLESFRYQPDSLFETKFPQAFHFDRFYAHYPHSVKTLESLLFGIYPSPTQVSASLSIDKYAVSRMTPLPHILRSYGYTTTYYAASDLHNDNYGNTLRAAGMEHTELVRSSTPLTWGQSNASTLFARVAETLETGARVGKPQFIMAWTAECHMPYDYAEEENPAPVSLQRYRACSTSLARTVEGFIQQLTTQGRLRDTLIVILGDHGEVFPEERSGEIGHGQHVYEPSLHSSLLVFLPNRQGGNHDQRLFQPVDIPTTILSALHIPLPSSWVGRDIFTPAEPGRSFVVCRSMLANGAVAVIGKFNGKYVRNRQGQPLMFYDLNTDPTEQQPLPISDSLTVQLIEKRIATYTAFATHTWDSLRVRATAAEHEFPGSATAQWMKGYCITITPSDRDGSALISPTDSPECKIRVGPGDKHIFRVFPRTPFLNGIHIELDLKINAEEVVHEKTLRAWAKTSAMKEPLAVDVQRLADVWQTVTLELPGVDPASDPARGQLPTDVVIMIAPVDWPVGYTLRSVKIAPHQWYAHYPLGTLTNKLSQYLQPWFSVIQYEQSSSERSG